MKNLALIISAIFHPIMMATYSCLILYLILPVVFSPIPINAIPYFILTIFLTTALVPAFSVLMMRYSKHITNLDITIRKERKVPFLAIALFYALTTYMLQVRMSLNPMLLKLMILVTTLIFLIYLINLRFKISVHTAAICGVTGFFSALSSFYHTDQIVSIVSFLFLISSLTLFARLSLNRHTPQEGWLGAILGFTYFYVGFFLIV